MAKKQHPFEDPAVKAVFANYPEPERSSLLLLRDRIFDTAKQTAGVGNLLETLKWGQPAYLTPETRSGSTIRLGLPKSGGYAIFVHCQTTIISDFQQLFPTDFTYEGNRAIHFSADNPPEFSKLELLIGRALTYHL